MSINPEVPHEPLKPYSQKSTTIDPNYFPLLQMKTQDIWWRLCMTRAPESPLLWSTTLRRWQLAQSLRWRSHSACPTDSTACTSTKKSSRASWRAGPRVLIGFWFRVLPLMRVKACSSTKKSSKASWRGGLTVLVGLGRVLLAWNFAVPQSGPHRKGVRKSAGWHDFWWVLVG